MWTLDLESKLDETTTEEPDVHNKTDVDRAYLFRLMRFVESKAITLADHKRNCKRLRPKGLHDMVYRASPYNT